MHFLFHIRFLFIRKSSECKILYPALLLNISSLMFFLLLQELEMLCGQRKVAKFNTYGEEHSSL